MTVNTTNSRSELNGNGVTVAFPVAFYFLENAHLLIYIGGVLQVLTTDYSVTGAGVAAGGQVTFTTAPPVGVGNVVIIRDPDQLQATEYPPNDPFPAKSHETALDKLTMLVQRVRSLIGRSFTLPDSDSSGASTTVPAPQAGYLIGWNALGTALANFANTGGGSTLPLPVATTDGGTGTSYANFAALVAAIKALLGYGTAAPLNVGVAANNVVQLDANAKLPAVDGSQLTNLPNLHNYVDNGSFAVAQRVTMPTTDNAYSLDKWRLLLGAANAATVSQDTTDVPTLAKYACKLVVGSGNNNKFGIFQPIEGVNTYSLRGRTVTAIVPLKATAGLTNGTGKIRIGILQWTGTEDAVSGDPVSAWGAEGTNPTLAAGWAFANVPAALSVTTAWADYTVSAAVAAGATNLALMIWSDDTTNTQTTDILRIGGYVALVPGTVAPAGIVAPFDAELRACMYWYEKSYDRAVAPAAASSNGMAYISASGSGYSNGAYLPFKVPKRAAPTMVYYDSAGTTAKYSIMSAGTYTANQTLTTLTTSENGAALQVVTNSAAIACFVHYTADASL